MQSHSFLPSFFSIITSRTLSSITKLNMHHRTFFLARGKAKKEAGSQYESLCLGMGGHISLLKGKRDKMQLSNYLSSYN